MEIYIYLGLLVLVQREGGMCVMGLARENLGVKELKVERDISHWDL